MAIHNQLGKWGEQVAAEYLQRKGYTIVARNWKCGRRDLDIVAMDDDMLVVVEVKTRSGNILVEPEMAVDYAKLMSLRKAANMFVKSRHINAPLRFDIISIAVKRTLNAMNEDVTAALGDNHGAKNQNAVLPYEIEHYQDISMY